MREIGRAGLRRPRVPGRGSSPRFEFCDRAAPSPARRDGEFAGRHLEQATGRGRATGRPSRTQRRRCNSRRPAVRIDRSRSCSARGSRERPGVVVSKESLLRSVWGDKASDPHALEMTISRLRRQLGDAGTAIQTIVRRGYRLKTGI